MAGAWLRANAFGLRPARTRLSREGRDTLWLLAVLSLIMALHAPRLPWWANLGAALAVCWRARLAWRDGPLPPRWLLLVGLAISMGLTAFTFHTLFGREAGVTLVTLLASLKTLELRARRDAFVVTSLGFFLILTQFLYSQGPVIAVLMLGAFIGLLTSLVLAQRPLGRPSILSAMGMSCRSLLMGLPVMLALYVLFPRLGPLWSVPADAQRHTGLSDRIELGRLAELAQDDSVAMRIKFEGPPPPKPELYFRGPVLDIFDGQSWSAHPSQVDAGRPGRFDADEPIRQAMAPGTKVAPPSLWYQATLEPTHTDALPLLEGTVSASLQPPSSEPQLFRRQLSWKVTGSLNERVQLRAEALRRFDSGDPNFPPSPESSLQLPAGSNPRAQAWAQAWRHAEGLDGADGLTLTRALLSYIRAQNFRYSLNPGGGDSTPSLHPIDQFWLDRRVGFCEHFATSYVFILRNWGIPSRVITGFQGAELNPVDGLYVVRNSDAHAWAEIWVAGQGWLRVDPTAAVAPERIERPRPSLTQSQRMNGPLSALNPATWTHLRNVLEAGNHRWNSWVLQYSRNRQLDLLRQMGVSSPDWTDLLRLCAGVLLATSLAGLGWLWWSRPRERRSPWTVPMKRVHRALAGLGVAPPTLPAPAPALAWAHALQGHRTVSVHPQQWSVILNSLRELDHLRYGPPSPNQAALRHAIRPLVDRIETTAKSLGKRQHGLPRY
jgi:transglutaminase-like putative cysteine protease